MADNLEALRAARRTAQDLSTQNLPFGRIEEVLLAQGFNAEVTQITMSHLMQEQVSSLERNVRFFRLFGAACLGLGVVVLLATGVSSTVTHQAIVIPGGLFIVSAVMWFRAFWTRRQIGAIRAHRWLSNDTAGPSLAEVAK